MFKISKPNFENTGSPQTIGPFPTAGSDPLPTTLPSGPRPANRHEAPGRPPAALPAQLQNAPLSPQLLSRVLTPSPAAAHPTIPTSCRDVQPQRPPRCFRQPLGPDGTVAGQQSQGGRDYTSRRAPRSEDQWGPKSQSRCVMDMVVPGRARRALRAGGQWCLRSQSRDVTGVVVLGRTDTPRRPPGAKGRLQEEAPCAFHGCG